MSLCLRDSGVRAFWCLWDGGGVLQSIPRDTGGHCTQWAPETAGSPQAPGYGPFRRKRSCGEFRLLLRRPNSPGPPLSHSGDPGKLNTWPRATHFPTAGLVTRAARTHRQAAPAARTEGRLRPAGQNPRCEEGSLPLHRQTCNFKSSNR